MTARGALAIALLLAACKPSRPIIHTCADPVGGVWRVDATHRYHIYDLGRTIELYPMWDATVPPDGKKAILGTDPLAPPDPTPIYSPPRIELMRDGERLEGSAKFRLTRAGVTCDVVQPARMTGCAGGAATLSIREVRAVDPATCDAAIAQDATDAALTRE